MQGCQLDEYFRVAHVDRMNQAAAIRNPPPPHKQEDEKKSGSCVR